MFGSDYDICSCRLRQEKREIVQLTLSTEDAEAILAAAGISLPSVEETPAAGSVVKWYAWHDPFHNYSDAEVVNTGYFTFTEKYGCEVEWIECTWKARFDDLATLLLGGTPPDAYRGDSEIFPYYAIKGVFQPVDEYIDYEDPLWAGTADFARSHFTLGGKTYMIVTDVMFDCCVAYNRRVMSEWGFDDPAELYYNDEWTWNAFYEMCVDFSDPDENRYALDGWMYDNAIMESGGIDLVTYDTETGLFVSNLDDPRLEKGANLINDLKKNDCIFPVWANGWQLRGGAEVEGTGIKEGLCLFWLRGHYAFTGPVEEISNVWGDITANEIMFCPMPRDDEGDGNYYTTINSAGYTIIKDCENPEGVALLASCDRFKILDPTVVSIDRQQLEDTYLWTDEMLDMYDHLHDLANTANIVMPYNEGLGLKLDGVVNNCKELGRLQTPRTWAQVKESYGETLNFYIDELNQSVIEFNEANK